MKNIVVKCIAVLSLICLCTSLLLAVTNRVTAPVIEAAEAEAARAALAEVMPEGGTFEEIEKPADTPSVVTDIWKASNGGYVFRLSANGYAPGIIIMCGIGPDGRLTGVRTVSCNETAGYGKQCEEVWYQTQYTGKDASLEGVDNITGATKTSGAYRNAVKTAFETFAALTGKEGGAAS